MAYKKSYTKTKIKKKIETDKHKNKRHKKNNTSYSPITIISTKYPATQMTYKKPYTNTKKDTKTDTDTNTNTDTNKTQRQREKKRRINKIVNIYIYKLINKTQKTYPQRLCTTNFLQSRHR